MKVFKILSLSFLSLVFFILTAAYLVLYASLPDLDGEISLQGISQDITIHRDAFGTAIIHADNKNDAAFALGYSHAQDRRFQMDLLRRNAAGEVAEIIGTRAVNIDKKHRFHQFRQRAKSIYQSLPLAQQQLLLAYASGVNAAVAREAKPFEYWLLRAEFTPWQAEDTLLATFSMYLDLQNSQVERDYHFTGIESLLGKDILHFLTQASPFQATMDFSIEVNSHDNSEIPPAPSSVDLSHFLSLPDEPKDIGSNNWAVSGALSKNNAGAILANDMHLGLNVPALWYKAQLNYQHNNTQIQVTGVSLPGTPFIVVGATDNIAWGFTNSNVDNVDWVKLDSDTPRQVVKEVIKVKGQEDIIYELSMSKYGPVRELQGQEMALVWVAHQDYAINLALSDMPLQKTSSEALALAKQVRIPVQNMVVADASGNVAWQLTGAISARTRPSLTAINEHEYSDDWLYNETNPASMHNPEHGRVWSANARMVSANALSRYGNGGYALGIRQKQIADQLMAKSAFDEDDFYSIQLDNRALFLQPWHDLLLQGLKQNPALFDKDIKYLESWGSCACADSVGYTLVRRFRSEVINILMQSIEYELRPHEVSLSYIWRSVEPAAWQLIQQEALDWLPKGITTYDQLIPHAYLQMRDNLFARYADGKPIFEALTWGEVNRLSITHPLASSLGPIGRYLNMPSVAGFGDSYMPAVQSPKFGASQRLFAQPGHLENAILTLPGGQSMHPLSAFYDSGFEDYVKHASTPLLPQAIQHSLHLSATKQ